MPYPLSSTKSYGGGSGSSGLGSYSAIPTSSYMPGFSFFGRHDYSSSGRTPFYGGSSAGSSLALLGLSSYSMPSIPSYPHVSPYAAASSSYGSYGSSSYGSSSSPKSYYTALPTISEHSSGSSPSGNKRRIPRTYIPVLPLPSTAGNRPALYSSSGVKTLYTEDIDVTTPRKSAVPAEISRKRSGGEGYGTIRRGRTVIRLETKKLKENPYLPTPPAEDKNDLPPTEEPKQVEKVVEDVATLDKEEENIEKPVELEPSEDNSQLSKDYSQVAKWYEEEMKKPIKTEKKAGDKFREKYMVHSKKNKYSGYRRPTLSDIRAQKAVVLKEIEERLKKLADASGADVPEELQAEAQKLEKDKERLARLDKKMAKRFSRALRKAEHVSKPDGDTSDDESVCIDRQSTVKVARKLSVNALKSSDLPVNSDEEENEDGSIQGQRLTRKVTKRFFFPQEAISVVQPEIIEASVLAEPEDLFEKNILAQRQTVKMRSTQKKVAHINQRKSSASDLEIPGNLLSDKLCDVEMKPGIPETPEDLEETALTKIPSVKENGPGSTNTSGKKKKFVKKVGDPPAKRVPGNILQPLITPPKDSDSILESPTEDEIEAVKQALNKKNVVGKVNGLVNAAQGLKSNPFLKNNLATKPIIPNKFNNKLTNDTRAGPVGTLPGMKTGEVKSKAEIKPTSKPASIKDNIKNIAPVNNKPVVETASKATTETTKVAIIADDKKEMSNLPQEVVVPPAMVDKRMDTKNTNNKGISLAVEVKNEKSEISKTVVDVKKEVEAKPATNDEKITNVPANEKGKPLTVIAKLKPKLALDNKSASLDGLKPKFKLDNKSSSFDASDDKKIDASGTKNQLINKELKQQEKKAQSPAPVTPPITKLAPNEKPVQSPPAFTQVSKVDDAVKVKEVAKPNEPTTGEKKVPAQLKKPEVVDPEKKETIITSTPVPKKEVVNIDKKEIASPKEETLKPIKKIDEQSPPQKKPVAVKDDKSPSGLDNNVKKISPKVDNESLAKQNLTPVKVEEKVQQKPGGDETKKSEGKASTDIKNVEECPKLELKKNEPVVTPKEKAEVKSPPLPPKDKSPEEKPKAEAKGLKQMVAPLELKEKLDIKSPPMSPKTPKSPKKSEIPKPEPLTSSTANSVDLKKSDGNAPTQTSKAINESKSPQSAASEPKSLPNGHLSPTPPSSPKGKGIAAAVIPQLATGKQAQQKSPQPSEATQKESVTVSNTGGGVTSAKVENLGCSAETATNGPEKKKSDSTSEAANTNLPDIPAQMNKLGTASEKLTTSTAAAPEIGRNSDQKSISSTTTNTVGDTTNENSTTATVDSTSTNETAIVPTDSTEKNGTENGDGEDIDTLPNSEFQSFIRKSLKRGSPRRSSESSLSSSGSSASTAKSGMISFTFNDTYFLIKRFFVNKNIIKNIKLYL